MSRFSQKNFTKARKFLFNRNHISIERIDFKDNGMLAADKPACGITLQEIQEKATTGRHLSLWDTRKVKVVTRESPLGFTYEKHVDMEPEVVYLPPSRRKVVEITSKTCKYILTYPVQSGENRINVDVHPWMISDKSGMPDHMLKGLQNNLGEIFNVAAGFDKFKDIRDEVYTDMFGYPTGPKFQTNDEKILSHGFDLKVSFRKRKEE